MYSSSNSSASFYSHRGSQESLRMREMQKMNPIYNAFIEKGAANMIADFDGLKASLENATNAYLTAIKYNPFRRSGRKRAQDFKSGLDQASTITELLSGLKEAIKIGNEDDDSFKTFIYQALNSKYCNNKFYQFEAYPLRKTYTSFLNDTITAANKQLEPIIEKTSLLTP